MYYRHKTLPVKAWHFQQKCDKEDIPQWLRNCNDVHLEYSMESLKISQIVIGSELSGSYPILPGNWIVLDENGEISRFVSGVFEARYEKAEATS